MNPTNESIGRAFDDVAYSDDDLRTIVQDWDESDPIQKTAMDLALKVLRLREADGARELDRQAPGVPDWQSVADQMAAAIAPGEWVMVPRELRKASDMWEAGVRARNRGGTVHDVWDAMIAAAPQPPAQEQGEILDTLADAPKWKAMPLYRRLSIHADSCALVCDESKDAVLSKHEICAMHDDIREAIATLTRAAGAEDARDAEMAVIHRFAEILPGPIYMDPPDGGDVSVFEQFSRMARDAERYRWLRNEAIRFEDERGSPWVVYGLGQSDSCPTDGTELDAMVDAAIASQAKEGGNAKP